MEIQDKIKKTITKESILFMNDEQYKEFSEYYKKLKDAGIARKEEYTIPLVKTIGTKPVSMI